jgi:alpha-L-arabinofuranosidase
MRTGTRVVSALAATGLVVAGLGAPAYAAAADAAEVRIGDPLAVVRPGAIGVNTPIWNPFLLDRPVPGLIRQAGLQTLEFNGGPLSDLYHWKDATVSPDPDHDYSDLTPQVTFGQFEKVAHQTGAQSIVHVNYGTGTPQEAADWVHDANRVKHDNVRDWAIGEEVWGNGGLLPTINFEPDAHADKSPQAYGTNALQYIKAMKAADPTIRVGIELVGVETPPFGAWDDTVMSIVGPHIDFVDFHAYPLGWDDTTDIGLFRYVHTELEDRVAAVRALADKYAGAPGHHIELVAGETNSGVTMKPQQISQFNALYLADDVLGLLESGVRNVDWWALHNGGYGQTGGDLGLLSSGDCNADNSVCPPPVDTPFPPYYGLQLVGAMARPGGTLLRATSSAATVSGHAVREADGSLAVLLANESPATSQRVHLDRLAARGATVSQFVPGASGVRRTHVDRFDGATLPPYSLTLVQLR